MSDGTLTWHDTGTVRLGWHGSNDRPVWGVTARPHVMIRLKRLFPRVAAAASGSIYVTDTLETARDLEWLRDRHPLDAAPDVDQRLAVTAAAHRDREHAIDAILAGRAPTLDLGQPGMTPRPHQETFVQLVARTRRVLLGDAIGLGKTISAAFMLALEDALPAAIVVPTHLPRHWETKLHQVWPQLAIHTVTKGTAYDLGRVRGLGGRYPDVLIVPYSKLAGWSDALAGQVRTVVFEEVQELRHGTDTRKGQAAARISHAADYAVGLSATPAYNYGSEIHNVMEILAPDSLGSRTEFLREWGGGGASGKELVADPAALGTYLRQNGLLLRRTRKDTHQEMPAPVVITETVAADQAALDAVSGDVAAMARLILDDGADRRQRFVMSGELDWKLRQATGIAKAPYVAEFVRLLLETEDRVVLWGWHRAVYDIWMDRLAEYNPVLYTGSESPRQKNAAEDAFKAGSSRVLVMSLRSGAGLDGLQEVCSVGVFGELDWSPKQHEQCIGRLDRDGQAETPAIYYLVADDGSDPVISEVLQLKEQQTVPLMDPDAPLFEVRANAAVAADRVRLLARAALERATRPASEAG